MDVNFNAYKTRFELMNHLFGPILRSQPIRNVTIYINLDDVFHTLHRPMVNAEFQMAGIDAPKQVLSNTLNLIGHYRQWATRMNIRTNMVAVFTSARKYFKNSLYVPNYRKKYMNINDHLNSQYYFVNDALFSAMPLITTICHYLNGVYAVDAKYLEPSIIPLYLSETRFKDSDWHIMISRDTYDIQYAYRDKWSLLYPKGDMSNIINRDNIWDHISIKERVYKDERKIDLKYGQDLYLVCKAIVGDTYRSIPRLGRIGWVTIFKYLHELAEDSLSGPLEIKLRLIEMLEKKKSVTLSQYNANKMSVDADLQCQTVNEIEEGIIFNDILDIVDYAQFNELNKEFLSKYPANLIFLTQEVN